jgi:hypothetical protein
VISRSVVHEDRGIICLKWISDIKDKDSAISEIEFGSMPEWRLSAPALPSLWDDFTAPAPLQRNIKRFYSSLTSCEVTALSLPSMLNPR